MSEFRYTRPNNFPPIIKNLIIINVIVWVVQLMFDQQYDISGKIGLWAVQSPEFRPYQIVSHMFAHAAYVGTEVGGRQVVFYHILFNMFTLWMFGKILENVWGSKRFLFFYLACGLGSAIAHMGVQYFEYDQIVQQVMQQIPNATMQDAHIEATMRTGYAVGASGAVMGVLVAFAFLFPNTELLLFFAIPVKAKWVISGLILIDLFGGINPMQGDNIAHFAHLGGALTGFIIVFIWNKTNRKTFY